MAKHKPNGVPKWEEKGSEGFIFGVREERDRLGWWRCPGSRGNTGGPPGWGRERGNGIGRE